MHFIGLLQDESRASSVGGNRDTLKDMSRSEVQYDQQMQATEAPAQETHPSEPVMGKKLNIISIKGNYFWWKYFQAVLLAVMSNSYKSYPMRYNRLQFINFWNLFLHEICRVMVVLAG